MNSPTTSTGGSSSSSRRIMPKRISISLACISILGVILWVQFSELGIPPRNVVTSSVATSTTSTPDIIRMKDQSSSSLESKVIRSTDDITRDDELLHFGLSNATNNNNNNKDDASSSTTLSPFLTEKQIKTGKKVVSNLTMLYGDDEIISSNMDGSESNTTSVSSSSLSSTQEQQQQWNPTKMNDEVKKEIDDTIDAMMQNPPIIFNDTNNDDDDYGDRNTTNRTNNDNNNNNPNNNVVTTTNIDPVQKIILLGERHSGTNWITDYLTSCFDIKVSNEYTRFKHWFQSEDLIRVPEQSAVVIVLFRDPYDWVEAMRVEPHHAHDHLHWIQPFDPKKKVKDMAKPLHWKEFVTKPWIGKRGKNDEKIRTNGNDVMNATICMDRYNYVDVAPCSQLDSIYVRGLGEYKYEYQHDGSERGFPSIIELRRDKILNMLSVANFRGTRAFFPFRYEDLNWNGTSRLLRSVEEATGLNAKCNATMGKSHRLRHRRLTKKKIRKHDALPNDYIHWMNQYVDWEVEGKIGYSKRGGAGGGVGGAATTNGNEIKPQQMIQPSKPTTPVEQIILLGERHSGTNWITDYLMECFDIKVSFEYKRFKHWFQEEDLQKVPEQSAVVVAMFRDPYDWVEAMRLYPHHSHDHLHWFQQHTNISVGWQQMANPLGWKSFVTKPWIGRRGPRDKEIGKSKEKRSSVICMDNYTYVDAAPCTEEDSPYVRGLGQYKYEYQHDGSERGFSSIIDLRRDKIKNILSVADFRGTRAFLPFRYEDLDVNGTLSLLMSVEDATGFKAMCNATMGKAITTYNALPNDYISWMNKYVDWDIESRIGYSKRELKG